MSATKSPMTSGLQYDKFQRHSRNKDEKDDAEDDKPLNAKEILQQHNNNVGSFYNDAMTFQNEEDEPSMYDEMIMKLSKLLERNENSSNEDLSDISGDPLSQVYYYSITAILLYVLYRILYTKKR
jgi:hypothetical protein